MHKLSTKYASLALVFGSLFAVLVATGCGGDDGEQTVDLGSCPSNSTTQQSAGQNLVTSKCVTCHSSMLSGASRGGAPVGLDYDVATKVKSDAALMYSEAYNGAMPPGAPLSETEIENIRIYLACLP
jgi:cytochrome c5